MPHFAIIVPECIYKRQKIYDKYRRFDWADWQRTRATEGDQEALTALRARETRRGFKSNTVSGEGRQESMQIHPEQDSVTKKGTIIYRVGPTAVRDEVMVLLIDARARDASSALLSVMPLK